MATNNAWNTGSTVTVPQGGTGIATTTAYAVMTAGTTNTGNMQNVSGVGSSTNVLISGGASALPAWGANAGVAGSLILISTQAAANVATLSFTSGITSTYKNYIVIFDTIVPANTGSGVELQMLFSVDGGSNYLATNYQSGRFSSNYNSATMGNSNATTFCLIGGGAESTQNTPYLSGSINLYNLASSTPPAYTGVAFGQRFVDNTQQQSRSFGYNTTTTGVNALRFLFGTGNITSGTFTLYGVAK